MFEKVNPQHPDKAALMVAAVVVTGSWKNKTSDQRPETT